MPRSETQVTYAEVRKQLIAAEVYAAYSTAVLRRVNKQQVYAKWIVAAAACAPFVAQLTQTSSVLGAWVPAVVPLVAVGLPIWQPDKTVERAATVRARLALIIAILRPHWRTLIVPISADILADPNDLQRAHEALREAEKIKAEISSEYSRLPDIPKLRKRAAESVPDYDDAYLDQDIRDRFADPKHVDYLEEDYE